MQPRSNALTGSSSSSWPTRKFGCCMTNRAKKKILEISAWDLSSGQASWWLSPGILRCMHIRDEEASVQEFLNESFYHSVCGSPNPRSVGRSASGRTEEIPKIYYSWHFFSTFLSTRLMPCHSGLSSCGEMILSTFFFFFVFLIWLRPLSHLWS